MRSLLSSSYRRGQKGTGLKQPKRNLKRRAFLRLIAGISTPLVIGGLVKAYIWDDPSRQWLLTDLFPNGEGADKLTLAPPQGTLLDDASHLDSIHVAEIRSPKTVAEVIKAV